jgi:hypothetical protein
MKNQIFHLGKFQNLILKKGPFSFWEIKLVARTTPVAWSQLFAQGDCIVTNNQLVNLLARSALCLRK